MHGQQQNTKQVVYWETNSMKQEPGRPRKNWINAICQDVDGTAVTWKENMVSHGTPGWQPVGC